MQTPFELLEVAEDATNEAIKKAYLRKVREYPPERDAAAFQRIRAAFEHIETERQRLNYRLFHHESPDLSAMLRLIARPGSPQRPGTSTLIGALTEGLMARLVDSMARP